MAKRRIPKQSDLLVPKGVSFNPYSRRGYVKGTKAFVSSAEHRVMRGTNPFERAFWLRRLAEHSSHFIKPFSKRTQAITDRLSKAGIAIEQPIEKLKNGTALFEKAGFGMNSDQGLAICKTDVNGTIERMAEIVARIHSLGITHNHLHLGNWVINPAGKITVIDWGRATMTAKVSPKIVRSQGRFERERFQATENILVFPGVMSPNGETYARLLATKILNRTVELISSTKSKK